MEPTLIPPIAMKARSNVPVSSLTAAQRVESTAVAAIASCKSHAERVEFWQTLLEWTTINLANVDGRVGGSALAGHLGAPRTESSRTASGG